MSSTISRSSSLELPKQCSPMEGRRRGTGQDEQRACLFKRPLVRSWFQLVKVPAHVSLQLRPPRQSQSQSQRQAACQLLPGCERAALQSWTRKNYKLGRVAEEEPRSTRTETSALLGKTALGCLKEK